MRTITASGPVPAHRKRLVVVIPGIGGSVLRDPVRGRLHWSDRRTTLARLLTDPGRISIDEHPDLEPVGLLSHLQLIPWWGTAQGYRPLWERLSAMPGAIADAGDPSSRVHGATLVAFPYDFRQSIRHAAERLASEVSSRLDDLGWHGDAARRSVIVVAHSMGGLVARYWAAVLGGDGVCDTIVTLGTPHRGAPKALEVAANGLRLPLGSALLRPLSAMVRQWPSLGELLPRYPCIRSRDGDRGLYPHELPDDAGHHRLRAAARRGWDVHQEIEKGWAALSGPPVVRPRIGYGLSTLSSAVLSDDGSITVDRTAPTWCRLGDYAEERGDGTVPAISALPLELEGSDPTDLRSRSSHGRLSDDDAVTSMIRWVEVGRPITGARSTSTPDTTLDLLLPDAYAAHEPHATRATIHRPGAAMPPSRLIYAAMPAGGAPTGVATTGAATRAGGTTDVGAPEQGRVTWEAEWDSTKSIFESEIPALAPGLWTITGRTTGPGASLTAVQDVAVLDPTG